jgi:hypothetical protein
MLSFPKSCSIASLPKIFARTLVVDHHRQTFVVANHPVEDHRQYRKTFVVAANHPVEDRRYRQTFVAANFAKDRNLKNFLEANPVEYHHHRKISVEQNSTKDHHRRYLFLPVIREDNHLCQSSVGLASLLTEDHLCKIFVEDRPNPIKVLSAGQALLLEFPKELEFFHRHQKVWCGIPLGRVLGVVRCLPPPSICVAFSRTRLI